MTKRVVRVLGAFAFIWPLAAASPPDQPMIGQPAPSFRLPDLSGKPLALEAMRGRFIVLHFGASW